MYITFHDWHVLYKKLIIESDIKFLIAVKYFDVK